MQKSLKVALFATVALGSSIPLAAQAQDQAPAGGSVGLEEIVVTVQRRDANMQSVPIAVTAIPATIAEASGIRTVSDIQVMAPSINWGTGIGGANITLRGIGSSGSTGDEGANAIYVDGVYNPVGASLLFSLNNIERMEVAKGPQGTLFGRNASGGAIQIFTRDPDQEFKQNYSVTFGNYKTVEGSAYISGGLTDNLAADLAVFYSKQGEGWGHNVFTGEDAYLGTNWGARTKWKWTPDDKTSVVAIYTHNNVEPPTQNGGSQIKPGEGKPYYGFYNVGLNFVQDQQSIQDNASLHIRRDIGWATFVSITAYDFVDQPLQIDADFSPARAVYTLPTYNTWSRAWTQEFQLLSPATSKLDWALGFYYYDAVNYRRQALGGLAFAPTPGVPGIQDSVGRSPATSWALYGQATYPITERTRLTGGLRYTVDDREITGYSARNGVVLARIDQDNTDREWTWRAAIDHDLTDDVMLYASVTRGFKSGFFNVSNPTNPPVLPQFVDAYEAGFKSEMFDNRVRLNASAFFYEFTDIQVRRNVVTGPIFLNAAEGEVKGLDIDFQARPIPELQLQGGFTYLDAEYTDFPGAPQFALNPAGGIRQLPDQNAKGKRLVRSPEISWSFGGQYEVDLASAGTLTLSANYYYNDGYFFDPQNRVEQPSYSLVNAAVTWKPNDTYSIMLWGKNLTDEERITQVDVILPTGDDYFPEAPRTYGVTLRAEF